MKKTGQQVGLILAISLVAAGLSAVFHPKRPPWYRVASAEELRWQIVPESAAKLAKEGSVLWVDARSREKYEAHHLTGAILLNLGEWGDLMFQHMDVLQDAMDQSVIVYCDTGDCKKSVEVATRLRELLGLEPVYVLKGEWSDLESLLGDSSE